MRSAVHVKYIKERRYSVKKQETITVRVTSQVKSMLVELSKKENRSMANMIETLVLQAYSEKMKDDE
jgi:hypothetical protein